jgi:ABC-type amino acid transport substrate-binding protein
VRGATLVTFAVLALAAASPSAAADAPTPPAERPTSLVVALSLGESPLQAGVVRGRDVILARGFEVALVRTLARRLGSPVGRFVDIRPPARLQAMSASDWHLAVGAIEPRRTGRRTAESSVPYLTTDHAVVLRRGLPRPRSIADLRQRLLCATRGTGALEAIARAVRPARSPLVATGPDRLRSLVRAGACDAAVLPAFEAGRFVSGQARLLGPIAGRLEHGEGLVVAVARGSGVSAAAVDRELRRMRSDGTLGRLARAWLGVDPAALRRLR